MFESCGTWIWKGGQIVKKRRHSAEQIISKLREAEVLLAKGMKLPQVCRKLGDVKG